MLTVCNRMDRRRFRPVVVAGLKLLSGTDTAAFQDVKLLHLLMSMGAESSPRSKPYQCRHTVGCSIVEEHLDRHTRFHFPPPLVRCPHENEGLGGRCFLRFSRNARHEPFLEGRGWGNHSPGERQLGCHILKSSYQTVNRTGCRVERPLKLFGFHIAERTKGIERGLFFHC